MEILITLDEKKWARAHIYLCREKYGQLKIRNLPNYPAALYYSVPYSPEVASARKTPRILKASTLNGPRDGKKF